MSNFLKTLLMPLVALINKKADRSEIPVIPKIPTMLSELRSDSSHQTISNGDRTYWNSKSNFDGDYNSLVGKPTIPANVVQYVAQELSDENKAQARANIGAGTSSFSGDYNDLGNKPNIPAAQVQGDWSINDESDISYIKHRPFYDGRSYTSIPSVTRIPQPTTEIVVGAETMYYGVKTGGSVPIPAGSSFQATIDPLGTLTLLSRHYKIKGAFQYVNILGNPIFAAQYGIIEEYESEATSAIIDTGDPFCLISYNSTAKNEVISREYGIWFAELLKIEGGFVPMDDVYIPSTIQRVGGDVIIKSSTEGSTKQFKITVDDSGTLIAAEITE